MQYDESDTINLKTQSEIFADYLCDISVKSTPNKLGTSGNELIVNNHSKGSIANSGVINGSNNLILKTSLPI
ncbi:MAG: hypothetical protein R1F52_06820 [Candidatus Nitrosoabyssus spongiisocia]|nr:MAG: hypothetical protein R1F52_06820 [Nitrosopumilaceae archaeon AB1(1)]